MERTRPDSALLIRTYQVLLGLSIFRGYRQGLERRETAPRPAPVVPVVTGHGRDEQGRVSGSRPDRQA